MNDTIISSCTVRNNFLTTFNREISMVILFSAFATIGLFGVICNLADAAGNVICALLKYIVLPFGLFLCICCIIKYGL